MDFVSLLVYIMASLVVLITVCYIAKSIFGFNKMQKAHYAQLRMLILLARQQGVDEDKIKEVIDDYNG